MLAEELPRGSVIKRLMRSVRRGEEVNLVSRSRTLTGIGEGVQHVRSRTDKARRPV